MKIYPLRNVRLFRVDDDRLESHFQSALREIKLRQATDDEDSIFSPNLSTSERNRISRRAKRIIAARSKFDQAKHLKRDEREHLQKLAEGVILQGPATVDEADQIAAILNEEMPWLQPVIVEIWRDMRHHIQSGGYGLKFKPTLLQSDPGMGKTHLINRLSALCNVPVVSIDGGSASEGFQLSGLGRGWSGSEPGRPLKAMMAHAVANPLVSIDELDKAGTAHGQSGMTTSLQHSLLSLLEPVSAKDWNCPAYQVSVDMSHISYIAGCNSLSALSAPLRSRFRVVEIERPTQGQVNDFVNKEVRKRGLDNEVADEICDGLAGLYQKGISPSIRQIVRLIEGMEAINVETCLQ